MHMLPPGAEGGSEQLDGVQPGEVLSDGVVSAIELVQQEVRVHAVMLTSLSPHPASAPHCHGQRWYSWGAAVLQPTQGRS